MPFIIPIFIPHEGCPHSCSFCNQHRISGRQGVAPITPAEVAATITSWLAYERRKRDDVVQVAFYGGSFTGLPRARQAELLGAVAPFLARGLVQTIRLSTRPDYVDAPISDFLRAHRVSLVELGVQSLDNRVLALSGRGHSAEQARRAVGLLRAGGLAVGIQLMVGLPGQSRVSLMRTTREVVALQPDCVRIYPVLVVAESPLAGQFARGVYRPLSLGAAVVLSAWMKKRFDEKEIPVVRMGLQSGPELEKSLLAGPYHPAFGELVASRLLLAQTRHLLAHVPETVGPENKVVVTISPRDHSVFRGLRSRNLQRLAALGLGERFVLATDEQQPRFTVRLRGEEKCGADE